MKALILAGGRGTRLAPLTDNCPKPMLPIAGVPMVERIMTAIAQQADVREFVLVTGYRADVVQDYFGTGDKWDWRVHYAHQAAPRGVGDAVHCARALLSDAPFLMTYGDIMLSAKNYGRIAAQWQTSTALPLPPSAIVTLNWVDDPYLGAAVSLNDDRTVARLEEKPPRGTATTHWNNAGLFVFAPLLFDYTARLAPSARGELELPDALSAMIRDGYIVKSMTLQGDWRDVGTPADYAAVNTEWERALSAPLPPDMAPFDAKVMGEFLQGGRLRSIPVQRKKKDVVLRFLAEQFHPGRTYTEQDINFRLLDFHEDYATLRRELVDTKLMERENGIYRRLRAGRLI